MSVLTYIYFLRYFFFLEFPLWILTSILTFYKFFFKWDYFYYSRKSEFKVVFLLNLRVCAYVIAVSAICYSKCSSLQNSSFEFSRVFSLDYLTVNRRDVTKKEKVEPVTSKESFFYLNFLFKWTNPAHSVNHMIICSNSLWLDQLAQENLAFYINLLKEDLNQIHLIQVRTT